MIDLNKAQIGAIQGLIVKEICRLNYETIKFEREKTLHRKFNEKPCFNEKALQVRLTETQNEINWLTDLYEKLNQ